MNYYILLDYHTSIKIHIFLLNFVKINYELVNSNYLAKANFRKIMIKICNIKLF